MSLSSTLVHSEVHSRFFIILSLHFASSTFTSLAVPAAEKYLGAVAMLLLW